MVSRSVPEPRTPAAARGSGGLRTGFGLLLGLLALSLTSVVWLARTVRESEGPTQVLRSELVLLQGRLHHLGQTHAFTGLMLEPYADGTPRSRSMIVGGRMHGLSEGWHTNGVLAVREQFRAGVSHGLRTKWYASGRKLSEAMIVDGKIEGTFRRWHENGTPAEQMELHQGQPEGVSCAYYPSGFLKAQARLHHGQLLEQRFWADGEIRSVPQ